MWFGVFPRTLEGFRCGLVWFGGGLGCYGVVWGVSTDPPDTVVFNLTLISSSLFLTYHLLFPLTIMLLFFFY